MSLEEKTDGQLLAQFAAERADAPFTELVRRHGKMVCNICRRVLTNAHDAEDASQAVFLVLAAKAASLHNSRCIAGWLYNVARNVCNNALKASHVRDKHESEARSMSQRSTQAADMWERVQPLVDNE